MLRRREVVHELQEAFPGSVYGPMNELVAPSQRKYTTAINAALGKFADCIVVESFEIGKVRLSWLMWFWDTTTSLSIFAFFYSLSRQKSVDYLKRKRKPPLEFAPLDTITKASPDPRVYSLGQCKPALDCCQFDEKFEPVFRTALHDSLIVDNLGIAEHIAYVEAARLNLHAKVITLDGEKILKNGNITVDTSVRWNNHQPWWSCFDSSVIRQRSMPVSFEL